MEEDEGSPRTRLLVVDGRLEHGHLRHGCVSFGWEGESVSGKAVWSRTNTTEWVVDA
jgi:hypothetical protein